MAQLSPEQQLVGNVACWSHTSSRPSVSFIPLRRVSAVRPVRLRVSVGGGNWLWWSPLSRPLHGLFGSTPNYSRRLPNGPRSSTPKGGSGRVAYEGRCVGWRAALLVSGAEATPSWRRLRRINRDLGTQKGRIYSDAGWRDQEQSIARSNWVCTLLVCVRRVIYFCEFEHASENRRKWRSL